MAEQTPPFPENLSNHPRVEALREALSGEVLPCSTGAFPVKPEDLVLFYGKDDSEHAWRIDFASTSEESLKRLSDACDAATFGINEKDVLDESYRKAGKLETKFFAPRFDPVESGLVNSLRDILLEGHGSDKAIRTELYKLNVYGPGSFFKAHKDTPRSDNMFASLVVVYPTAHVGGALRFRHGELEYTFDSAHVLAEATAPSVGFAAFYSDVEHEVTTVESGYRVTLTYNLYFQDIDDPSATSFAGAYESALMKAFRNLLADHTFLPNGGHIGFGLRHEYAIDKNSSNKSLKYLEDSLKGSDAVLMKVCKELSLEASPKMVYNDYDYRALVLLDGNLEQGAYMDAGLAEELRHYGGKLLSIDPKVYELYGARTFPPRMDVEWATPIKAADVKDVETAFVAYGNEPSIGFAYSALCIVVGIDPAEKRLSPA